VYGSNTGLVGRNQTLTQASPGVAGNAESGDLFGAALARGIFFNNFNGDDFADLAVGAPGETVGGQLSAGAANIQYGSAAGLPGPAGDCSPQTAKHGQRWNPSPARSPAGSRRHADEHLAATRWELEHGSFGVSDTGGPALGGRDGSVDAGGLQSRWW
jgi:FG-GAP repeat